MKSIATKVDDILKRQQGSKVTSILFNMFGRSGSSKRVVLSKNEEHNNITTTTTTVSDIIAHDKNNNKKSTYTSSRTNKFLSHVFRKKFVIDGMRKTSKLSLLRRAISAKRLRAAKREEECGNDQVAMVVVDELCLCKRRILMGMKCKPVNASGKLHYGQDGVILHED